MNNGEMFSGFEWNPDGLCFAVSGIWAFSVMMGEISCTLMVIAVLRRSRHLVLKPQLGLAETGLQLSWDWR